MGVMLYEGTAMRRLEKGVRPRVITDRGSVSAQKVVLAVNAWMGSLFPEYRRAITVVSSDMGITEPCPQLLEKIAEFYDSQVKAQIQSLTSLIEPLLISVMGVIVGGVVLSVFLPILNVVGELSGQG